MNKNDEYQEEDLPALLPIYYNRIFPSLQMVQWLSYGDPSLFGKREISLTLLGDIYLRYNSFETHPEFLHELVKKIPVKIDIGAIYQTKPKFRNFVTTPKPVAKELVFDIDLSDYDDVRTCCAGANICTKCWKFMAIASKILDKGLRDDFNFKHILWVFSGRRGIHCWVADKFAREYDDTVRSTIAEYFQIIESSANKSKPVSLSGDIHSTLRRALAIIDQYFIESIVKDQDILGSDQQLENFCKMMDENLRKLCEKELKALESSEERWNRFETIFRHQQQSGNLMKTSQNLIEEVKLLYAYPRLDINVTKGLNHLLKSPFCVHPKTGKVCIPFNVKNVDNFDPVNVPTIKTLVSQIDAYDEKTRQQQIDLLPDTTSKTPNDDNGIEIQTEIRLAIKDYKKTSLLGPVSLFIEFLRNVQKDERKLKEISADASSSVTF